MGGSVVPERTAGGFRGRLDVGPVHDAYDDLVVVLMRGGFTRVEETLHQSGRSESVKQQRADFEQAMLAPFKQVVEEETRRKVIAFMSSSHQHPDLLGEMFVLESAEVLTDD